MLYRMPLTIHGVDSTGIVAVNGPVAHMRGGASPHPCDFLTIPLNRVGNKTVDSIKPATGIAGHCPVISRTAELELQSV